VIDSHKAAPQKALIKHLNPIIRGWANYYSTVVSKDIFSRMDNPLFPTLDNILNAETAPLTCSGFTSRYFCS
ncbi:MAG: group II intron reverse transcriptase/maturase, partial [Symploca sp. SIO1B1]|nr:group II intron reverse transcriptase/maturase [Symploca sp. SIO1B1]